MPTLYTTVSTILGATILETIDQMWEDGPQFPLTPDICQQLTDKCHADWDSPIPDYCWISKYQVIPKFSLR